MNVYALKDDGEPELWRFLHRPCTARTATSAMPIRSRPLFSFNSAYGACDTCRGFGRVIGVDYGLVIPDPRKTLRNGAIKTLQTPAWQECQDDLMKYAGEAGIPRDTAWMALTDAQRDWVINGSPHWAGKWNKQWYGIKRFFEYLESKAYKMHIRVLLSKYRSYTPCPACAGARLKTEALLWRLGSKADADGANAARRPRHAARRAVDARSTRSAARPDGARPDADAHRAYPPLLRRHLAAQHDARRSAQAAARRDPRAPALPVRRGHRLPHARPPEPNAQRRRGCSASTSPRRWAPRW